MDNPYQPSAYSSEPVATGTVTLGIQQTMAATRPWVRLCAILGFIGAGLCLLSTLGVFAAALFGNVGMAEMTLMLPYLVIAAIYLYPSIKLWKYASAIHSLLGSSRITDLEEALRQQQGFWKFAGIMILVTIGLMILGIFAGIAFG
jgi:hypothetical protein